MSFVLYTQILKQSVLKPASPGITLKGTIDIGGHLDCIFANHMWLLISTYFSSHVDVYFLYIRL